jgi:hypothetical protein
MSKRKPLLLQADTVYFAADFVRFEYASGKLTGSKAILRLHLKNRTIIDLPVDEKNLTHLLTVLCDVLPEAAISRLVARGFVDRKGAS